MTSDRFATLAEAYGSDIGRWPVEEQDAARAYLQNHPDAEPILVRQAKLDAVLDAWVVSRPDPSLATRIMHDALARQALLRRARLWISSAAAAAALAGGVAAGMSVVTLSTPRSGPGSGGLYELQVLGVPLDAAHSSSLSDSL
jgi:hypothetical protein